MATTSSPRSSSASHMCEPRNPPPPVTTTRAIGTLRLRSSGSADGLVDESSPFERVSVEQIPCVYHSRHGEHLFNLGEVKPAKLIPLREDEQYVRPVAGAVGVVGDLDAVKDRSSAAIERRSYRRIERLDSGPLVAESTNHSQSRRFP